MTKLNLSGEDKKKLDKYYEYCSELQYFNIGYPQSADIDYSAADRFLKFILNNVGDWAEDANFKLNSFEFEKEVMEYFFKTFKINAKDAWGYVTNGGTEGNMFGCYLARKTFPGSILFYTKEAHYSIAKIIDLLQIPSCVVERQANGIVDYDDLISKIQKSGEKHPIILANIGSTVHGSIDDIRIIQEKMKEIGFKREDYYIHADAALSGMILPFVENPQPFRFEDGIDSIAVSGHKMLGTPIPCGVVVGKKCLVDAVTVEIDYILAHDKTITGSRNGHTPIMLWLAIKGLSYEDMKKRVDICQEMADYVIQKFRSAGYNAWRHKNSITVVVPIPSQYLLKKWSLAPSGKEAHIITSTHNHWNPGRLDDLCADLIADYQKNNCTDKI